MANESVSTIETGLPLSKANWTPIYILALLTFAISSSEMMPAAMMPLMAKGLHTTEGMIGQAITASAMMGIISSLNIGRIAGERDRRLIFIVFGIALVISNLLIASAANPWVMLAARLLLGTTVGTIWGLIPAAVLRLAPEGHFARSLSLVLSGSAMSGIISIPLAAFAGSIIGWRMVYVGVAVLAALAVTTLLMTFPALPARNGGVKRDLRTILLLPGLLLGMGSVMMLFGGSQAFYGYLVPFLEDVTNLSPARVSLVLLVIGITGVSGTMYASKPLSRSIYAVLVVAPAALTVLTVLMLLIGHRFLPAMIIMAMWTFTRSHIGVGANAWVARTFEEHAENAGGALVAFIQFSMMLGAMLGGVLIDHSGPRVPPVAGAAVLAIGAVYSFFALRPRTSPDAPDIVGEVA